MAVSSLSYTSKADLPIQPLDKQIDKYIPKIPTNNCLCGISVYFNPLNSFRKKENYDRFAQIVRAQGLNLTVIELYIDEPEVNGDYADQYKAIQMDKAHAKYPLWQKEALINVGISYLDEIGATCKNIAWLDIEIMISYPYWIQESCKALESYAFVQPFVTNKRLSREETLNFNLKYFTDDVEGGDDDLEQHRDEVRLKCKRRNDADNKYRHGMVWTARRNIFKDFRLFPYGIIGGGDTILLRGLCDKNFGSWLNSYGSTAFVNSLISWAKGNHLSERFSTLVGHLHKYYLYGSGRPDIVHFWHGDDQNRKYGNRNRLFQKYPYAPNVDIITSKKGYLHWSDFALEEKVELVSCVNEYFLGRHEDGRTASEIQFDFQARCFE